MTNLLQCYNRGCGQQFDPEKNTDDSCRHHPGAPFFHDAYKGWSCCKKRSVDFTEFLGIKGCTLSKHSNVKPPEPEKPKVVDVAAKQEVTEVKPLVKEALERPPVDSPMVKIEPTVAPALKEAIDGLQAQDIVSNNTANVNQGEVAVGTVCKNCGCNYVYTGTSADFGECQYHSGVAVFHEGMKYWSCCQKKTSDFSEFMAQKGCSYGQHNWFKQSEVQKGVQCRYDWHQTPTNIIVSIYAKFYHYSKSVVYVNPIRLNVSLIFPKQEDAVFNLDLELRGVIDTEKVKVHMFGTKVEITLPKAEPGSWPKLDFPRKSLPPPKQDCTGNVKTSDSDDEFNLDDVEPVNTGFRLTEIATTKPE